MPALDRLVRRVTEECVGVGRRQLDRLDLAVEHFRGVDPIGKPVEDLKCEKGGRVVGVRWKFPDVVATERNADRRTHVLVCDVRSSAAMNPPVASENDATRSARRPVKRESPPLAASSRRDSA